MGLRILIIHPRSKHWHQIDFVLSRQSDLRDIRITRALRGADCWTDHCLVRTKLKLQAPKRKKLYGTRPPRKINVAGLKSVQARSQYQRQLFESLANVHSANEEIDSSWTRFRDGTLEAAGKILGSQKKISKDWFDDNDESIRDLLSQKNLALAESLADPSNKSKSQKFKELRSLAQLKIRQMKDAWFKEKSALLQHYAISNNAKSFYSEVKAIYGPSNRSVAPVRDLDGNILTDIGAISNRWSEHFQQLLNRPSAISPSAIAEIDPVEPNTDLDDPPTVTEIAQAVDKLQCGKAGGPDGISPELLKYGGPFLLAKLSGLLAECWSKGHLPSDLKDAHIVHLYKGKGDRSLCDNHRGISLLSVAGKVLARVILDRLTKHLLEDIVPESQCGFRRDRGTVDMIFSIRQLQEKCREQQQDLYILFLDLTKAFDTVSREGLWQILPKIGCPPNMARMISELHDGMSAQVIGGDAPPFPVTNGVKQGCVLAPTLFSVLFSLMLTSAFKECSAGVEVRYRTDRGLYDLQGLKAKTKVTETLVRELLYADDCAIVSHSEHDLQMLTDLISSATKRFGLTISIKKTEVLFQAVSDQPPPCILIDGQQLKNVDEFTYLGSCVSSNTSLDREITSRIAKASRAFGRLNARVWLNRALSVETKVSVYRAVVLTALLYGCETWTTYRRHVRMLESFHQKCLRAILNIRWQDRVTNTAVLQKSGLFSVDSMLCSTQLRWSGHVSRMKDDRLPKQIFYSELTHGSRRRGRPLLRYKDTLKERLSDCDIPRDSWENLACDRPSWRTLIHDATAAREEKKRNSLEQKRAARKSRPQAQPSVFCPICSKGCASQFGLMAHSRVHRP